MLPYFCISLVLINVVESDQVSHNIRKNIASNVETENIFTDVIKNISRVNNVLQELISNYEQLQKIYKSQENVESEISDSEIDEVFKSKKKQRSNIKNKTTTQPVSEKFGATQMFWSEDDDTNEESNDSQQSDSKGNNKVNDTDSIKLTDNSANAELEQYSIVTTKKTTTMKHKSSSELSDTSSSSTSEEKPRKIHRVILKKIIRPGDIFKNNIEKNDKDRMPQVEVQNIISHKKPNSELIFIDTHKKLIERYQNQNKAVDSNNVKMPNGSQIKKLQTRYSKINNSLANVNMQPYAKPVFDKTRKVKKILRSEVFSPQKIWKDIINNKPILLEAHNDKNMNVFARRHERTNPLKIQTRSGKTAFVIVTKNNNGESKNTSESTDSDTNKEEIEERALRKAYGDACLKVVVKKCYKANMKVSKSVCGKMKCKSALKETFKSSSKTACVDEFGARNIGDSQKPSNKTSKHKRNNKKKRKKSSSEDSDSDLHYRGQENEYTTNTGFVDMTRGGFFSAACFPYQSEDFKKSALRNETNTNQTNAGSFNILRDRFEKECQKVSTKKCRNACTFAYKMTCEKHTCSKRMKKLFKKSCKTECSRYYKITAESNSSEYSDSDEASSEESEHSESGTD